MFENSFADHKGPKKMAMTARSSVKAERPSRIYKNIVKRVMDSTLILLSLPFILPALIAVAVMIKRDGGSILYCQERVGINGRVFRMWKFRTMVPNAEEKLKELIANDPKVAREWDAHQKLKNDPRVTRIGAVLRKTSIDELPQLWNVLVGEMSLVGPRPMMVDQRELYPGKAYYDCLLYTSPSPRDA